MARNMATFLSQPQPGDGTWLINNMSSNSRGSGEFQMTRRRRRRQEKSFLTTADADADADVDGEVKGDLGDLADAGVGAKSLLEGNTGDGLRLDNNSIKNDAGVSSSPAEKIDVPRTLGQETSISNTTAPAPGLDITQHLQQHLPGNTHSSPEQLRARDSNYTTQEPCDMDDIPPSMPAKKKPLPPHLARKVVSSTEKTKSSTGASAPSRNGSARKEESVPDRSKSRNVPRGRGNGWGGGGNSFAAARAEIPKPDPKRWETNWNGKKSWDSSSFDSARASSGWGTRKKKRDGQTASPPAADWSGKLAPPPPDWDSRPGFRVDQSAPKIMDWMSEIEHQLCAVPDISVPLDDVIGADGTTYVFVLATHRPDEPSKDPSVRQMGEIVPYYWIPIVVGQQAPQVFWNELLKSSAPEPDDPSDLEGAKPWWERFVKSDYSCLNFLKDPPTPEVKGIDPDQEDAEQRLRRKHDMGSAHSAENRRRFELDRQQEKIDKQKRLAEKQRKLAAMEVTSNTPTNHNRIKPGFKLFVRSARADDMTAVMGIYNYYIENTTSARELERISKDVMVARYRNIRLRRMPFLVAYKPGGIVKAPRKKKDQKAHPTRDDVQLPDQIVGFAFADDYDNIKGMYRFTAEMEVYTRETEYMNGVASCLVDKLMGLLDSTYQERGGYEVQGDDIDGLDNTVRIIKNIVINLPYDKPEKLEWVGRWLEEWLKFKEAGILENIGTKNGKAVHLAIFQRETGVSLDHANPPSGFVPS